MVPSVRPLEERTAYRSGAGRRRFFLTFVPSPSPKQAVTRGPTARSERETCAQPGVSFFSRRAPRLASSTTAAAAATAAAPATAAAAREDERPVRPATAPA